MKQKLISNKRLISCICAAVVVIAAVVIVRLANREETFRSIMVYDVEGNAVIERENVGAMNAAENLYLESGDRVSVEADSSMRMKLDEDKYVMAEADTIFSVEAEGTEADSRTKISLEQGAITNEIQKPLSAGSSYETSTPNSVMAVRGTIYRVELYADEEGGQNTKLCCFQGKVGTKPVLSDGTYGEEIFVPAGSEVTVYQDGTVGDVMDIAYDALPPQAVANLLGLMENGQDVAGISREELLKQASEAGIVGEAPENETKQEKQSAAEESKTDLEDETEAPAVPIEMAAGVSAEAAGEKQSIPRIAPRTGQTAPQPQAPEIKPTKPEKSGSIVQGNTGGGDSQGENDGNDSDEGNSDKDKPKKPGKPEKPNKPTKPGKPNKPGKPEEPGKPDEPEKPEEPGKPDEPEKPEEPGKPDEPEKPEEPGKPDEPEKPEEPGKPDVPEICTVTFMYQGNVFATQTVKGGETAAAPVLAPAADGAWDFDFSTEISADTTISWK